MRLSPTLIAVAAFALAAMFSVAAATTAVTVVENRSVDAVQKELVEQGHSWVAVMGDGLQLILQGQAPSEAIRFRAISIAGGIVDASRVIDNMSVAETADIAAPDFAIEILRNDSGVSLIGLIPATTDREALSAEITRIAGGQTVTDLLQTADYPVPDSWRDSIEFGLRALGQLPRSKISVSAGHIEVNAISDSAVQQRRLETELSRNVPDDVTVSLVITAPRPVISPFTVRFVLDAGGARFDACSADTEETKQAIVTAAIAAGVPGPVDCRLGLGVPSRNWGEAVAMAIDAVARIGGGTVTFSDVDVVLVAAEGTAQADFDTVVGELSNALPDVYALEAVLPQPPAATEEGPPEFTATLSPEGQAQLRGRIPDDLINETVENFARARFGASAVTMGTRITESGLPQGWSMRVLAGIEALSMLSNGSVLVQPDLVTVRGSTGNAAARDEISAMLIEKLGQTAEFHIDVTYVEALDPIAALPTPEECVAQIGIVTDGRKITFEPGSATLNADALPIIDDIAEILQRCADLKIRISGYTDSQGRDEMNLELSQDRAESVLDALRGRRVPVSGFEAVGYGEANPIADNETEAGRDANRRIEFTLIGADVVIDVPTTPEEAQQAAEGGPDAAPSAEDAGADAAPDAQPMNRPTQRPELRPASMEEQAATEAEPAADAAPQPASDAPETDSVASPEPASDAATEDTPEAVPEETAVETVPDVVDTGEEPADAEPAEGSGD